MNDTFPNTLVVAIATVVAALITGVIAIVNLTLSKEQKVSELRQAWIDGLRADLATFVSAIRGKAVALQDNRNGIGGEGSALEKTLAERTALAQEALYRVKLRLNQSEPEHAELDRLLGTLLSAYDDVRIGEEKKCFRASRPR
jgi:hypothetical protein